MIGGGKSYEFGVGNEHLLADAPSTDFNGENGWRPKRTSSGLPRTQPGHTDRLRFAKSIHDACQRVCSAYLEAEIDPGLRWLSSF